MRDEFARLADDLHPDCHAVDVARKALRPLRPAGEVDFDSIIFADLGDPDAHQPGHVAEAAEDLGLGLTRPFQRDLAHSQ
jgi:hypothetical protein